MDCGRPLPWFCFFFPAPCLSRAWKHKESSWHLKKWNLGCPTDKKIILVQTQAFWRSATSWGGDAVQVWGAKAARCLWLCTHCPQPAPCSLCMGSLHSLHPCCLHGPGVPVSLHCWGGHVCSSCHTAWSSEQDTTDTMFDPPALTLMCFSSQTAPMKAFFVNFHSISTPSPKNFLSTQWGFG